MSDAEPTKLDYCGPTSNQRSVRNTFLAVAVAISLVSALLQVPWYFIGGVLAWLHFGDMPTTSAQNGELFAVFLIPSIVAVVLGLISLRLPKRHACRTFGILGLVIVGFYGCAILYVSGITWPRWL